MSDETQIEFQIFGVKEIDDTEDVRAKVFVDKLGKLLRALEAADKHAHGKKKYKYFITDLQHGSAYAAIREHPEKQRPTVSSIQTVQYALHAVSEGRGFAEDLHPGVVKAVAHIADGAGKTFSHGEVVAENVIRLDQFYHRKAQRALRDYNAAREKNTYFEGTVFSSFDGKLLEVDLRGKTAKAKLVLAIGGVELDCTCDAIDVNNLRDALNKRVTVSALAHYNGHIRLPEHLTIKKIDIIGENRDFTRWMGQFALDYPGEEDVW